MHVTEKHQLLFGLEITKGMLLDHHIYHIICFKRNRIGTWMEIFTAKTIPIAEVSARMDHHLKELIYKQSCVFHDFVYCNVL